MRSVCRPSGRSGFSLAGGGALFIGIGAALSLACADGGLVGGGGMATSRVEFSLSDARIGPIRVCSLADELIVTVTPSDASKAQVIRVPVPKDANGNCLPISFTITTQKGNNRFDGVVVGGGRLLLSGSVRQVIESDGFVVDIHLDPVDALTVGTRTTPSGGDRTYQLAIDTFDLGEIASDTVLGFGGLPTGSYDVRLSSYEPCQPAVGVDGAAPAPGDEATVVIESDPDVIASVEFLLDCGGTVHITTTTVGSNGPPGYTVTITGTIDTTTTITSTGSVSVDSVPAGPVVIELLDTGSCNVLTDNPIVGDVLPGDTLVVAFVVECLGVGELEIRTTTDGLAGPPLYDLRIDGAPVGQIGRTDVVTLDSVGQGAHTAQLNGVAPCATLSPNPATASVPPGGGGLIVFVVTCKGAIRLSTTAVGVPAGAGPAVDVRLDGVVVGSTLLTNPAMILPDIDIGTYTVSLDLPTGCTVLSTVPTPPVVSVPAGGTTAVAFFMDC